MLKVSNLKKSYGDVIVLDGISFVLNQGDRVGVIGPNGSGKSTLLQIIAGKTPLDGGSVQFDPPDLTFGYLEQGIWDLDARTLGEFFGVGHSALTEAERNVATLAAALPEVDEEARQQLLEAYGQALTKLETLALSSVGEHEVAAALEILGLGGYPLDTPLSILSGGETTRLGLAKLWMDPPTLLLLDEPTNHLDLEALAWLEYWLSTYQGAMLVVSHDRTFLDNAVTKIFDLDPDSHRMTEYVGNYTGYLQAWEKEREKQWAQWRDDQAEFRRLHQDIVQTRNQALWVEATTKPGQPTVRRYAKKVAKKAKSREKKLERYLESDERVEKPSLSWKMKLEFVDVPESGQDVLRLRELAAGYGGVPLFSHVNADLRAGERLVLVGPNGSGKTTLLRVITGELPPLSGEVKLGASVKLGYYAQGQELLDFDSTPFASLRAIAALSETDIRSFLHYFLFTGDAVFVPIGRLSYGERARLALACLVAQGCNFLVLDEPINHLDIPSRTQFERAMASFEGTVLAVAHDRYFIRQFATRIWALEDSALRSYGDLDDLSRSRERG